MSTAELPYNPWEACRLPPWRNLLLYVFFGLGGHLLALTAADLLSTSGKITWRASLIYYLLDLILLGGPVVLLSSWRNQLDLTAIGFIPPRVTTKLVSLAVAAWVVSIPFRVLSEVIADQVIGRNWHLLPIRQELIVTNGDTLPGFLASMVGLCILVPIAEELLFRGAIFGWFRARYNLRAAVLVSSAVFGLAHYDSVAHVASSFVLGMAMAYMFERTRTLWVPIAMHSISNCVSVCLQYAIPA